MDKLPPKPFSLFYDPRAVEPAVAAALQIVGPEIAVAPVEPGQQVNLHLQLGGEGLGFMWDGQRAQVFGQTLPQLLRSLAGLRGRAAMGELPASYRERLQFDTLGLMIDASRNAVPKVETLKYLLRRLALMGLNQALLYIEDTYEVPSQPYFGYLRGGYTADELREVDQYAQRLGIEVVPCIQTLGHCRQILQWAAFNEVKDTSDVLLVDEPETYRLIEQMIDAVMSPLSTKKIHVGMDEAHDLGMGQYLKRHGLKSRFELMNRHLQRVSEICNTRGLQPMIWSDMYFRLGSQNDDYYDRQSTMPTGIADQIPRDIDLVYWDYYHSDTSFYDEWIDRHRMLGKEPIFAAGLWTWQVFWQNYSLASTNTAAGMAACKRKGVRHAMATLWCDDGTEVDLLSILPGVQHFAELGYGDEPTDNTLCQQFWGSTNGLWEHWAMPRRIDETPCRMTLQEASQAGGDPISPGNKHLADCDNVNWNASNPSKFLLWQDPLLGLFDQHIEGIPLAAHYEKLVTDFEHVKPVQDEHVRGQVVAQLARVLADKAELGLRLTHAYKCRDRQGLVEILDNCLPRVIRQTQTLRQLHAALWHELYKPFGWEVLDRRYGGLLSRLQAVEERVRPFVQGEVQVIEELEPQRLPIKPWPARKVGHSGRHRQIISPTAVG